MSFLSKTLGIGLATWVISHILRRGQSRKRERQPEAVTRWEGEGGAIPDVEPTQPTVRYTQSTVRP